ncbi:MAG: glycosyltransferase, partial [Patescibacteria group bacterium]
MRTERKTLRAWWHTSVFWWVVSAIAVFRAARRLHPDVIHIHGKFSIPAGVLVGRLLRIPTVFTARDYRALCNYGRCISERTDARRCSFREYWLWEFPLYVREYTERTRYAWLVNAVYALRGRVWGSVLFFWVKRVDTVVCVSQAVERIYQANGIIRTTSIYNIQPPLARGTLENVPIQKQALYIGKLTPGKGAGLLPAVIKRTIERYPDLHWIIFTNGGILENQVKKELAFLTAQRMVETCPYVPHDKLLRHIGESMLVCIPSVWQEPLTRLALEALQSGTPVVITDRGGSREVVEDGVTGRLVPVDADAIADGIIDVVTQNDAYRARIQEQQVNLTNTFCVQPIQQHQALYKSIVAHRTPKRTLGVILPPGGSLTVLDRHGQKSRFLYYLEQYARAFDR